MPAYEIPPALPGDHYYMKIALIFKTMGYNIEMRRRKYV
jgi:hypothetical protein